jgi:hypothetical protein
MGRLISQCSSANTGQRTTRASPGSLSGDRLSIPQNGSLSLGNI